MEAISKINVESKNWLSKESYFIWQQVKTDPRIILYILMAFYVTYNYFSPSPEHPARALFVLFTFVGLFFLPPKEDNKRHIIWLDYLWVIATVVSFGYVVIFWHDIAWRTGSPSVVDITMGIIAIIVSIEATRRGMGWTLVFVVLAFLLYYFLGHYLPRAWGGHAPFSINRIVSAVYMDTSLDGIFGSSTFVMFRYIFLMYLFGKGLEMTGCTGVLIDFARAIVGTIRGGAALMAVVASTLVGTITGLATANIMITGPITIPLMKKTGFSAGAAGGVEAAACCGGQIMPPVMGMATFLMMAFLAVPYIEVIKAAIFPAILYYVGVGAVVLFYARGSKIGSVPRSEIPRMRDIIKKRELYVFFAGFITLLALIIMRYTPTIAALAALVVVIALSYFTANKITPSKVVTLIASSTREFIPLGAITGGVGIIIGATLSTGIAFRITDLLLAFTGGNLGWTLILTFIACIILGLGLPVIIIYIISVILMAPALTSLGIPPLAAHMFCFYAAVLSDVTPPVAMAAYVAANIAKTSFWSCCNWAMRFSVAAIIAPFAFVLNPSLNLLGDLSKLPMGLITCIISIILMADVVAGRYPNKFSYIRKAFFLVASIMIIIPEYYVIGIALTLILIGIGTSFLEKRFRKKATQETSSGM